MVRPNRRSWSALLRDHRWTINVPESGKKDPQSPDRRSEGIPASLHARSVTVVTILTAKEPRPFKWRIRAWDPVDDASGADRDVRFARRRPNPGCHGQLLHLRQAGPATEVNSPLCNGCFNLKIP
jgi:hypothetical protein